LPFSGFHLWPNPKRCLENAVYKGKKTSLLFSEFFSQGNVEKSRQLRSLPSPKRFAQAGRHFAVLTYSMYAPRVKMAAVLLDGLF
jgi:hypothetical protein